MVLVEISGVVNKKMLVSARMSIEQLKLKLPEGCQQKSSVFVFLRQKNDKLKVCPINALLRDLHQNYSDDRGYLNLITKTEAAF